MPTTKSAKKTLKTDKRKRARNLRVKKSLRAITKKLNQAIEFKKEKEAKELLLKAGPLLDRAVSKGVIPKNTAGRKKSRLTRKVNKLKTSSG